MVQYTIILHSLHFNYQTYNMEPYTLSSKNMTGTNADAILPPTTLSLTNQCIYEKTPQPQHENKPLYQINKPITTIPSKPFTSAKFERAEHTTNKHLFYLAHPAHARYRTDTPAYYLTSAERGMIGNVHFETTTAQAQKMKTSRPGFRALLSPGRSASDHPLFFSSEDGDGDGDGENRCQGLFTAKPITRWPWKGKGKGGYTWFDSEGEQVAVEGDGEGECERKLAITVSMRRDLRDVLVALWMLRLWFETAESKQARREGNHISPCRVHACIHMSTAN